MRLLFSTLATKIAEDRLKQTLQFQELIPEGLEGWDRLLVTDQDSSVERPCGYEVVFDRLFTHGKFNYSKVRNASMRYAEQHGYDWLIQANPDIVMLHPPTSFPENGLTSIMTYHAQPEESIPEVISRWRAGYEAGFIGTTYFLMSRDIFSKYRFHEEFYGYGYDDQDFLNNVMWRDRISRMDGTPFGGRAIHVSYPGNIWGDSGPDLVRNRALFEERWRRTCAGERTKSEGEDLERPATDTGNPLWINGSRVVVSGFLAA
jgi:hypothetical protein